MENEMGQTGRAPGLRLAPLIGGSRQHTGMEHQGLWAPLTQRPLLLHLFKNPASNGQGSRLGAEGGAGEQIVLSAPGDGLEVKESPNR